MSKDKRFCVVRRNNNTGLRVVVAMTKRYKTACKIAQARQAEADMQPGLSVTFYIDG